MDIITKFLPTHSDSKVDLRIPLWILFIPDDLSSPLVPSKGDSAVRVNQLLLHRPHAQDLLHPLKVPGVHLWEILSSQDTDSQCRCNQTHSRGTQQVPVHFFWTTGILYHIDICCTFHRRESDVFLLKLQEVFRLVAHMPAQLLSHYFWPLQSTHCSFEFQGCSPAKVYT